MACARLGYLSRMGGQITTPLPCPPARGGPNPPFFRCPASAPGRLAGSSAAPQWGRGAKSGARKKVAMRLMQPIHKNNIPNIHTLQPHHNTLGTHNMHKHNTNAIHKPLEIRTTHNTRRTSSHILTNSTNNSLTSSTQTTTAPTDYSSGTPPKEQATSPPTVGTLQTAPQSAHLLSINTYSGPLKLHQ